MTGSDETTGGNEAPGNGGDVLSNLPRSRPQRPSKRRQGSGPGSAKPRPGSAKTGPGSAKPQRGSAKTGPKAAGAGARRPRPARAKAAAGRRPDAVRPSAATRNARVGGSADAAHRDAAAPAGAILVGTVVQAAGELAQLGLRLGTRALRDAVGRLPRP